MELLEHVLNTLWIYALH